MELFLQRLFDGLSQGSVYALIALGLVIIYRGTGHLNFAQGEMALFCTVVSSGSLTEAARELELSLSAVSKRLAALDVLEIGGPHAGEVRMRALRWPESKLN